MNKPTAWIFDVDGTLADVREFRHYVLTKEKDFNKFHEHSIYAPAHKHVVDMVHKAKNDGHAILVVTARKSRWRNHTAFWLADNGIPSDALFMRGDKDGRKDYEVKKEILEVIKQTWNVVHAVDDNPKIIKLWTEEGIPTTMIDGWIQEIE